MDNSHVLKECFEIFIQKLNLIKDPFEQSFFSLVHLSYLQLFEDVNKRTARLVVNIPLVKWNLKPLTFIDVDQEFYVKSLLEIYEKNDISLLKELYIAAYKRSAQMYSAVQQTMGEPNLFKLKQSIHHIIRTIILEKITGNLIVAKLQEMTRDLNLSVLDASQLFQILEREFISLHDSNIARFKIKPSEFEITKKKKTV